MEQESPEERRAFAHELAEAEAVYEEAKRRHERSLAARVRAAGFASTGVEHQGVHIDPDTESDDSAETAHLLREAELKLNALHRQQEEREAEEDAAQRRTE